MSDDPQEKQKRDICIVIMDSGDGEAHLEIYDSEVLASLVLAWEREDHQHMLQCEPECLVVEGPGRWLRITPRPTHVHDMLKEMIVELHYEEEGENKDKLTRRIATLEGIARAEEEKDGG
jgi:hypothetical protein